MPALLCLRALNHNHHLLVQEKIVVILYRKDTKQVIVRTLKPARQGAEVEKGCLPNECGNL